MHVIEAVRMGLTFPAPNDPDDERRAQYHADLIFSKMSNVKWVAVTEETGQSGYNHFHALIEFTGRTRITNVMVERILGIPAHMHSCDYGWLDYMFKDSESEYGLAGDITLAEIESLREARSSGRVTDRIAYALQTDTLSNVVKRFPSYCLQHYNQVQKYYSEVVAQRDREEREADRHSFKEINVNLYPRHSPNRTIARWTNFVLLSEGSFDKKCHLWIYGAPSTGKSRFISVLEKVCKVYRFHQNVGNWQDEFPNEEWQIIAFDDYKYDQSFDVQQLNNFLDGRGKLSVKYQAAYHCKRRIPAIFTSNQHPRQLFWSADGPSTDALISRLTVVHVTQDQAITVLSGLWDQNVNRFEDDSESSSE